MTYAIMLLAGVVAWLLYRRQASDGTLPGVLSIRGAQVAVTNVDAVERRRVWEYQGPAGLFAVPASWSWVNRSGWRRIGSPFEAAVVDLPPGSIRLVPGSFYSDRVAESALQRSTTSALGLSVDWLGYDAWWAPRIVTVSEAQQLGVIEVDADFIQPAALIP